MDNYLTRKRKKLVEDHQRLVRDKQRTEIFKGVVVHVDGSASNFTNADIKTMMAEHGGGFLNHFGSDVTHVVCDNLPDSKATEELITKRRRNIHYVYVDWVVDSVKHGKRLPEREYVIKQLRPANPLLFHVLGMIKFTNLFQVVTLGRDSHASEIDKPVVGLLQDLVIYSRCDEACVGDFQHNNCSSCQVRVVEQNQIDAISQRFVDCVNKVCKRIRVVSHDQVIVHIENEAQADEICQSIQETIKGARCEFRLEKSHIDKLPLPPRDIVERRFACKFASRDQLFLALLNMLRVLHQGLPEDIVVFYYIQKMPHTLQIQRVHPSHLTDLALSLAQTIPHQRLDALQIKRAPSGMSTAFQTQHDSPCDHDKDEAYDGHDPVPGQHDSFQEIIQHLRIDDLDKLRRFLKRLHDPPVSQRHKVQCILNHLKRNHDLSPSLFFDNPPPSSSS